MKTKLFLILFLLIPSVCWGAIAYRNAALNSSAGTSTLTINKPTDTVDNDVMVAIFITNGDTAITPPAGWTLTQEQNTQVGIYTARTWTGYKVASSEGASYAFGSATSQRCSGIIVSFSGCDTTTPIDASSGTTNQAGPGAALSITTTVDNTVVLFLTGYDISSQQTITEPGGMTEAGDTNSAQVSEVAYVAQASAGATGNKTPQAGPNAGNSAFLIALTPSSGAPPAVDDSWVWVF